MTSAAPRAAPPTDSPLEGPRLIRAIGRWTMVALVINMVVGSGIFSLPARVHAVAGVPALLAYAACAVVVICITLCIAEVGSRFTGTGGPYLYAREAFGPVSGFLVGWLMMITRMTSLAIITGIMADYLGYFWPPVAEGLGRAGLSIAVLSMLALVNWLGVRQGAGLGAVCTIGKLLPIVLFVATGLFFVDSSRFATTAPPEAAAVTQAVLMLVFAFGGFEAMAVNAGEMKNPQRDLPFALLTGMAATTLLYVAIQVVCIGTLPDLASSKRPLADAATRFAGAPGGSLIVLGAVVSTFGAMAGTILVGPRVLFAMAERGHMPPAFAKVDPRFHTPALAILLLTAGGLLLSLTGTFTYLLGLNVLSRMIQYLSTSMALVVLRRRAPKESAPFRVPGAWAVVPVTIAACLWLIVRSSTRELRDVVIALVIGLAVYGIQRLTVRETSSVETPAG